MAHNLLARNYYKQRHSSDLAIFMVLTVAIYSLKKRKSRGSYHPYTNEYPWTSSLGRAVQDDWTSNSNNRRQLKL